jgi:type I restriction enzyme R subunit
MQTTVNISESEIDSIVRFEPSVFSLICMKVTKRSCGFGWFLLKREDRMKDCCHSIIDYSEEDTIFIKLSINQRSKDTKCVFLIWFLYINGLPVVFEFKSAIWWRHQLFTMLNQLTTRYKKKRHSDLKYNAFVSLVMRKYQSRFLLAPTSSFLCLAQNWRHEKEVDGIDAMYTNSQECSIKDCDIIQNFIYLPDSSKKNEKSFVAILSIMQPQNFWKHKIHQRPEGDGKEELIWTTGCGKSYTMLYLKRLLMKSIFR